MRKGIPMHRKSLSFVPLLLALGVFAVMPAVVQAAPHFYKNHAKLPEEDYHNAGQLNEVTQGTDIIAWGTLVLETVTVGTIKCENEFGGDVWNPKGGGAGETAVDAFNVYDCGDAKCEVLLKGKMELLPEGLGQVQAVGSTATTGFGGITEFGEWEGHLTEVVAEHPRLHIGNSSQIGATGATGSPSRQIKFLIFCEKGGKAELKVKSKGELEPELINGTLIGAAPSKILFGPGSGELEIGNVKEGKVGEQELNAMGYEGGEIISVKNP